VSITIKVYSFLVLFMCGLGALTYLSLVHTQPAPEQDNPVTQHTATLISMEGLVLEERDKTQTYHLALQIEKSDYNQQLMHITCQHLRGTISKNGNPVGTFKADDAVILRKAKIITFPGYVQGNLDNIVFEGHSALYDLTECIGLLHSNVQCCHPCFTVTADSAELHVKTNSISLANNVRTVIEIPSNAQPH
jgi:lipopolysaccharide export system protein LptC